MEFSSAIKTKKILPFATVWMGLGDIVLSEISQSEKDTYHMIHSYVESNEQIELTGKTDTDSQMESRWQLVGGGRWGGGGIEEEGLLDNSVMIAEG